MNVGVVGSRGYPLRQPIVDEVHRIARDGEGVVSGGAPDVDSWAEAEAKYLGIPCRVIRPKPTELGKFAYRKAAFARNREIVEASYRVVAFWDGQSNGTANTIAWAVALGKPIKVVLP